MVSYDGVDHADWLRIQLHRTALFYGADEDYGTCVAEGLGLNVNEVKRLADMSQEDRAKATAANSVGQTRVKSPG